MFRFVGWFLALLWFWSIDAAAATVSGIVKDTSGAAVPGASVEIRNPGGTFLAERYTDGSGRFEWAGGSLELYQIRVSANGLETAEVLVSTSADSEPVVISLEPRAISTRVVVNATRGSALASDRSPHFAFIKDADDMLERPLATIGNALEQEPGIFLQQSTHGQVSPFLRGLTGYQVLNLVDGVRFNNSTFRSGPNQYLALVEPFQAQRVEATLGPTGSQYGSDSLGGTIQVMTAEVRFPDGGKRRYHGSLVLGGASADMSGHAGAQLSVADGRNFWLGSISGRRHNDLRAGGGLDSRNVFRRLFGLPMAEVSDLIGTRQQDSGFSQVALSAKFATRPRVDQLLTLQYQLSRQDRVRGTKDLLGGLGRLLSDFDPQGLHFFYTRYEKMNLGFLDSLSGTFSLNAQSDGSRRQSLLYTDPIVRDIGRVSAFGYSGQGTMHRGRRAIAAFGGEFYDERISSEREVVNPASGVVSRPRPLYPDGSRYRSLGLFVQGSYDFSRSIRAAGGGRLTSVRFKTRADATLGIPESSQTFRDFTFHASLNWQLTGILGIHSVISRGFRAPNLNDLGAIGLNDLGYEIPAAETIASGALLSTDAGENAISKGVPLKPLSAESLMNYELGLRLTTSHLSARAQFFNAELYDPIVRRTLLFPAATVPTQLSGLSVTPMQPTAAQKAQGVVAVTTPMDPRAVKTFANDGRARYYGLEILMRYAIRPQWALEVNYAYLLGRELNPNRNVRRLPPQAGSASLRYFPSWMRPWVEVSVTAAGRQDRLSGGDIDDERIGASFRRRDIADFFNGSRVEPLRSGDLFTPTGETLRQIQDRVLPIGQVIHGVLIVNDNTRVPMYLATAGWATISIRSGVRLAERWHLAGAVENLFDTNYRFHGSGIDAPGRNAYLALSYRF